MGRVGIWEGVPGGCTEISEKFPGNFWEFLRNFREISRNCGACPKSLIWYCIVGKQNFDTRSAPKLSYDHDGFTCTISKKFHFTPDFTFFSYPLQLLANNNIVVGLYYIKIRNIKRVRSFGSFDWLSLSKLLCLFCFSICLDSWSS